MLLDFLDLVFAESGSDDAIVWNDRSARRSGPLRIFGCVVSDPPQRFLDLLAEVEERETPRTPERVLQKSLRARAASQLCSSMLFLSPGARQVARTLLRTPVAVVRNSV